MLRHAVKMAFRNFRRHKSAFFINVIGLAAGLACALLIFLWVYDELQVDQFHEKSDRLYRVLEHQQYKEGVMTTWSTPGLLAQTLAEEIPEVEHAATIMWPMKQTLTVEDKNIKVTGYHAGEDFFRIFSFDLFEGQPETVLKDPEAMVISRTTAEKLFGSAENAMGKTVEFEHRKFYSVTGIFEDVSKYSSLKFDMVTSYSDYLKENDWLRSWGNNSPPTIITLKEGSDPLAVDQKIANFVKERSENSNVTLFLKPFAESYLYGRYENGKLTGGRIEYVRLFSIIAIFILLIACINFMNLSTARGSRRAKEVGVKKTFGVDRASLIYQYLTESVLMAFISLILSVLLVVIFLPKFNLLTDKEISLSLSPYLFGAFLLITLITGLLAGSYPALYLSSFKPAIVLKGELKSTLGELWARRGLVIFQFTLSIILIISVVAVYQQVKYVMNKNLGYDKDQLVRFQVDGKIEDATDAFLTEALRLPGVENISTVAHNLVGQQNNTSGLNWEGKDPNDRILFEHIRVNYDLLETIGVELKQGRFFSREFGADTSKIILNEAAIKVMGFEDDPLGKVITLWGERQMEIIGVVKDFHFESLHDVISPLFFRLTPDDTYVVMARLEAGRQQEALTSLQGLYERFNSGFPFEYEFVDEQYARQYAAEQRVASLSQYFAGFAILISCLGLFGLAAFTGEIRRKEIGVRKVLGASVFNMVLLLTRDFTRLVLISILIGIPIAYLLVDNWLDRFQFKIGLPWWFFAGAGILVLVISWLTTSSQAFVAASVHPNECLRDE